MSDNKRYYYLKVKENFFDREEVIILQSMPDGYLYSDILMKMYLRSLKNEGKLMFKGVIPYTPIVLAQVVRHQVGTVEKALKIFQDLDLVEVLDNGAIYMCDIQNFIGESSSEADRIRRYRSRINSEKTIGVQMYDKCTKSVQKKSVQMHNKNANKCTPELEIELEKDKYISSVEDTYCPVAPDVPSPKPKKNTNFTSQARTIIEYFNTKANTKYKASNRKTLALIKARLKEGFTVDDFKTVIDKKIFEWGREPNMCQYLRPLTLFSNKFESYMNQPSQAKNTANKFANFEQRNWDWEKINEILSNE